MFDSGITAKQLIDELKNEVDIAIDIPDSSYVSWLDSLQQLLYTEIIKEQKSVNVLISGSNTVVIPMGTPFYRAKRISLSEINIGENESQPRFEDIHAFYLVGRQFIKTTLASGYIFPDVYFKYNDNEIGFYTEEQWGPSTWANIIYFVRPALVKDVGIETAIIMVPAEFIDLVKAKLRGEAYKLANEDSLAAKWLNDYNVLLETFRAWITDKSPNFGL